MIKKVNLFNLIKIDKDGSKKLIKRTQRIEKRLVKRQRLKKQMAELKSNEYTVKMLIAYLKKQFGTKDSGEEFNKSDIKQYCLKGFLPWRYGGNQLVEDKNPTSGLLTITMLDNPHDRKRKEKKAKKKQTMPQ